MRRSILFAFFLLAACGGGVRSSSKSTDAANRSTDVGDRQAFLLTGPAGEVISEFARVSSRDALDSCLNAWVLEALDERGRENEPVAKPSAAGLRSFLSECLASAEPGNVKSALTGDARFAPASARGTGVTAGMMALPNR